jgi:hypothetical protein
MDNGSCRLYTSPPHTDIAVPPYATLSHCCTSNQASNRDPTNKQFQGGAIDLFKLTKDNVESLHKEVPIEKLCKTFKEALTVTRSLDLEHLWIDSLCIIQDDVDDVSDPYRKGFFLE